MNNTEKWKILIVDDEAIIRNILCENLKSLEHSGKKVDLLQTNSAKEAKKILQIEPKIAVMILDVMMEEEDAGLQFAKYVRDELKNDDIRILIHTGQPGIAPQKKVANEYIIDGYIDKNASNIEDVYTTTKIALRLYEHQLELKQNIEKDGVQIISEIIQTYISMLKNDFVYTKKNLIEKNCKLMKLENEIQSYFRLEDSKNELKEGTTELKILGQGFNYENLIISHTRSYQISFMSNEEVKMNQSSFIREFQKRLRSLLEFKEIPEHIETEIKEMI